MAYEGGKLAIEGEEGERTNPKCGLKGRGRRQQVRRNGRVGQVSKRASVEERGSKQNEDESEGVIELKIG